MFIVSIKSRFFFLAKLKHKNREMYIYSIFPEVEFLFIFFILFPVFFNFILFLIISIAMSSSSLLFSSAMPNLLYSQPM